MDLEPIDYRTTVPIPMTRFEFGVQVGQKTLLFTALGVVIGSVVWCIAPFVLLFLLGGSVWAAYLTRGRSVCGWVGIGVCLAFGLSAACALVFGK